MRRTIALTFIASGAILGASCADDSSETATGNDGGRGAEAGDATTETKPAQLGLDTRPVNTTCKAPARPSGAAPVKFEKVFASVNLGGEMQGMAQAPGDKSRWYVAQRGGSIARFDIAAVPTSDAGPPLEPTIVADVGALAGVPVMNYVEAGLLGVAFHPKFATNGRLYVSWVSEEFKSVVGYLTSTDGGATFTQYTKLLDFDRFAFSHCGGALAFGRDGFLYASFGDGGVNNDYYTFGQSLDGFQAKILRVDVDTPPPAGQTYVIPDGNPFKNGGGEPATYARGFRNPYRFSFDRGTGDLWVGDVGEGAFEEIDRVVAGANYGWSCREGMHDHENVTDPVRCPSASGLAEPIFELPHSTPYSRALIGGNVYRGSAIPSLVGSYIFAEFVAEELYTLSFDPVTAAPRATVVNAAGPKGVYFNGFAEDVDGETYVYGDFVHKLVPAGPAPAPTIPERLSQTGCFDGSDPKRPAAVLVPFAVNAERWNDGATQERWLALPDGTTIATRPDGDLDLPQGSMVFQRLSVGGKPIETRMLVRHVDGGWSGYSYEWNEAGTDAVLLPAAKKTATWTFPGRDECVSCHTRAAGGTLGLEASQLNRDGFYPTTGRSANQLATLEHIGMLDAPLGKAPKDLPALPTPSGAGSDESKARAYLHASCSSCHRSDNVVPNAGVFDVRFTTPFAATKTCNTAPTRGDLGISGARLIVPGDPARSLLLQRIRATTGTHLPRLASRQVDADGAALLERWIAGLSACP